MEGSIGRSLRATVLTASVLLAACTGTDGGTDEGAQNTGAGDTSGGDAEAGDGEAGGVAAGVGDVDPGQSGSIAVDDAELSVAGTDRDVQAIVRCEPPSPSAYVDIELHVVTAADERFHVHVGETTIAGWDGAEGRFESRPPLEVSTIAGGDRLSGDVTLRPADDTDEPLQVAFDLPVPDELQRCS